MTAGRVGAVQTVAGSAQPAPAQGEQESKPPAEYSQRDSVGDLNNAGVRAGDFPGAYKIPGSKGISLAIGVSVMTVVIADSNAEAMGADFTPAFLGTKRNDNDEAFNIDSNLTKLFLDGRAPAGDGLLRAYVEWDMNSANDGNLGIKMRHAYGNWKNSYGILLAGHTWSIF